MCLKQSTLYVTPSLHNVEACDKDSSFSNSLGVTSGSCACQCLCISSHPILDAGSPSAGVLGSQHDHFPQVVDPPGRAYPPNRKRYMLQ